MRSSNEVDAPFKRSSVLFGDATFVENLNKVTKTQLEQQVTFAKFWFLFRQTLPISAPLLFVGTFLLTFGLLNKTDGYMFCGSLLSVVFNTLAILSYYHVKPWRRHPSPLIMQVCLTGLVISLIFLVNTWPFGRVSDLADGEDIKVIDNSAYQSDRDHAVKCIAMSMIMQLALLAREAWILTLSLDLLTSITNPFASHTASQRKYHLFVWMIALAGALILINHKQCQGQFLSNGVCWIRIDGIESACFWGYFFSWMITFYINAAAVLAYAYNRISNGLESTYATRYACVADTFRVVFFYFSYGLFLAVMMLLLYYVMEESASERATLVMQHLVAYFIACRGFFDALVWFFTHGFLSNSDTVTNFAIYSRPHCRKLTMQDILRPRFLFDRVVRSLRLSTSVTEPSTTHLDSEHLTSLLVNQNESMDGAFSDARHSTHLPFRQDSPPRSSLGSEISGSDGDNEDKVGTGPPSPRDPKNRASSSGNSSAHRALLDLDVSPQLNLALRREVVELVTQGICESVRRLQEREAQFIRNSLLPSSTANSAMPTPQRGVGAEGRPGGGPGGEEAEEVEEVSVSSSTRSILTTVTNSTVDMLFPARFGFAPQGEAAGEYSVAGMGPQRRSVVLTQPPNLAQSFRYSKSSHGFSRTLHGLLGVIGTHLPGEYGVDHSACEPLPALQSFVPGTPGAGNAPFGVAGSFAEEGRVPTWSLLTGMGGSMHPASPGMYSQQSDAQAMFAASTSPPATPGSQAAAGLLPPPPPAEVVFDLHGKHRFRDFRPATFRKLRRLAGLTEEQYLNIIGQPTRERLSEGGSGAFFFICGDGDFIVKTVEHSEATTLLHVLDRYTEHIHKHPESFLVRFLGLHEIKMYGNKFMFVIMKNVFPPGIALTERYDIKGSWVNRHAGHHRPGQNAVCRHCHESFIEGSHAQCAVVVGEHEASQTLKDNDMTSKIRLYPQHAYEVIDTLYRDSDALCEMGLTDYSLLVGVQHARYDVEGLRSHQLDGAGERRGQHGEEKSADRSLHSPSLLRTPSAQGRDEDPEEKANDPFRGRDGGVVQSTGGVSYHQQFPARIVIAPQDYYFGVIDVLQTWSWRKKLERWVKVYVLGQDAEGVSCMCPEDFRTRFQKKIGQIMEHAVFVREVTGSWQGKREIGKPYSLVS